MSNKKLSHQELTKRLNNARAKFFVYKKRHKDLKEEFLIIKDILKTKEKSSQEYRNKIMLKNKRIYALKSRRLKWIAYLFLLVVVLVSASYYLIFLL